ncbi:peptidoglycan DD-metalloendopeptidase family protein [Glutamicibacter sp. AOP5-A2-18]|uniref:peptidoglycan DD-metalloendopeptidase family protein n=1 Tax=Glutamicibacter sp. AOP5-A2-18 TaxID=3457656 RepID=UPI004033A0DB
MKGAAAALTGFAVVMLIVGGIALSSVFMASGKPPDKEDSQQISCTEGAGLNEIPGEYRDFVIKASEHSGIPVPILVAQIDSESNWNPKARSPYANGISQFTPDTWAAWGNSGDVWNPEHAIAAQGRYMKHLKDFVSSKGLQGNTVDLALAAYNAGPGNVSKHGGIPPFVETQKYVKKINRLAQTKYNAECKVLDQDDIELVDFKKSGKWKSPLPGGQFTSGYGERPCPTSSCNYDTRHHQGIDLSTGGGGKVSAPADMEVTFAGNGDYWSRWYGTWILGRQIGDEGFVFEFHHCQHGSLKVKKGQKVAAGTQLCVEGNTGNSAGAHLHFQLGKPGTDPSQPTRRNTVDPKPILIAKGVL